MQSHKLNRYKSHDDLDVGALMQRNRDTNISTMDDAEADSPKHKSFTKIRRTHHNRTASRLSSMSLTKQLSLNAISNELESEGNSNGKSNCKSNEKANGPEVGTFTRNRSHSQPKNVWIPQLADSRCNGWRVRTHSKITSFTEPGYYHHHDEEYLFMVCNDTADHRQIWKYDVKSRSYSPWTKYPDFVGIDNCTVSVDAHSRKLLLVGSDAQFMELRAIGSNESAYKWKEHGKWMNGKFNQSVRARHGLIDCGSDPSSIYISRQIGQFHVVGGMKSNYHLRWDADNLKFVPLHQFDFCGIRGHRLLFVDNEWNVSFRSKLLLLGGSAQFPSSPRREQWMDCDHILCADIRPLLKECKWTTLEVKLPRKMAYFGALVYRHCFVVLFGGRSHQTSSIVVWYLNLNSMQWTQSKVKCPRRLKGEESFHAVLTKDERVHLFVSGGNGHFTMRMRDIIPEQEVTAALEEQERVYMEKRQKMAQGRKGTYEISRQTQLKMSSNSSSERRESRTVKSVKTAKSRSERAPGVTPGAEENVTENVQKGGFPVNHLPIFSDDEQPDDGRDEQEEEEEDDAPPVYEINDDENPPPEQRQKVKEAVKQREKEQKQQQHEVSLQRKKSGSKSKEHRKKSSKSSSKSNLHDVHDDDNDVLVSPISVEETKARKSKRKKKKKRSSRSPRDSLLSEDPHGPKRRKSSKHSKRSSKSGKSSRDRRRRSSNHPHHKSGKRQKAHPENPGTSSNGVTPMSVTPNDDALYTVHSDIHGNVSYDYSPEGGHRLSNTSRGGGCGQDARDIMEGRFNCTVFYEWMAGLCTLGPSAYAHPHLDHDIYYDEYSEDFEPGSFDDSYHSNQSYEY